MRGRRAAVRDGGTCRADYFAAGMLALCVAVLVAVAMGGRLHDVGRLVRSAWCVAIPTV